jgi:gas vesicle protein
MNKNTKRFAIGTVFAAVFGFLAGILSAPKSGKETRQDIKNAAVETKVAAEKQLKRLHTELGDLIDQANAKKDEYKGKAKKEYDDLVDRSQEMKQKARVLISAIHEGDAEDKDLKIVLSEAQKVAKHLKAFLKK